MESTATKVAMAALPFVPPKDRVLAMRSGCSGAVCPAHSSVGGTKRTTTGPEGQQAEVHHFSCLWKASVLPSVCLLVRPPLLTSSLGVINSSPSYCSSAKLGVGALSLWSFSRQSKRAISLLEISGGRRTSSCLSPNLP